MYSFHKIKTAAGTLMVGFLLAIAFAATAQAGGTTQGLTAQQQKAEQVRGNALNRYYHLGAFSPAALARQAEERRGQAMNRYYHLGAFSTSAARQAEERRGQAMNRYYHLGSYAVVESSSSFQWPDAGIGAGAMLGAILVAGGLAVTLRRRGGGRPSVPRSV